MNRDIRINDKVKSIYDGKAGIVHNVLKGDVIQNYYIVRWNNRTESIVPREELLLF